MTRPILCALLASLLTLTGCKGKKPGKDELIGSLRTALDATRSYRVKLETTTRHELVPGVKGGEPMRSDATLAVVLPDKMALEARSQMSNPKGQPVELDGKLVLDGQTAWISVGTRGTGSINPMRNVLKLDQKKVATEGKPLQIGFAVNGLGLRGGEEYVGTLRAYLEDYAFEPKVVEADFDGAPAWKLEGKLDLDKLLARLPASDPGFLAMYLTATRPGDMNEQQRAIAEQTLSRAVSMTVRGSQRLVLFVSKKDRLPLGWELGTAGGQAITRVKVVSFERDASIAAEAFQPAAEVAQSAQDKTEDLAAAHQRALEALRDPAAVKQALASLKAAIEKGLASLPPAP